MNFEKQSNVVNNQVINENVFLNNCNNNAIVVQNNSNTSVGLNSSLTSGLFYNDFNQNIIEIKITF
jgi:hypothetical protein